MRQIRLWLLRHAPVHASYIYGQQDLEADLDQPDIFQWLEKQLPKDLNVISSDLKRCIETAKMLDRSPSILSSAIREQHFGSWQGLTYDEARDQNPDLYDAFWEAPEAAAPPEGESFQELCDRVRGFLDALLEAEENQDDILLVTHAGVIRAILSQYLHIPLERALSLQVAPLSVSRVTLYMTEGEPSVQVDWINRIA
ncbi:MAG: histidine phosphatase family protein [Sneathiella sp.]|nr:histidine phosphatase family protein [Sneathiella sp.]